MSLFFSLFVELSHHHSHFIEIFAAVSSSSTSVQYTVWQKCPPAKYKEIKQIYYVYWHLYFWEYTFFNLFSCVNTQPSQSLPRMNTIYITHWKNVQKLFIVIILKGRNKNTVDPACMTLPARSEAPGGRHCYTTPVAEADVLLAPSLTL